jgi:F0F1-type ATP synthase assembly protein I
MKKQRLNKKLLAEYAESSQYMGLGLYFAVAVLLFTAVGWWIDQYFNTLPLFTIIGLFGGAGGGFYRLYILLMAMDGKENKECGKG